MTPFAALVCMLPEGACSSNHIPDYCISATNRHTAGCAASNCFIGFISRCPITPNFAVLIVTWRFSVVDVVCACGFCNLCYEYISVTGHGQDHSVAAAQAILTPLAAPWCDSLAHNLLSLAPARVLQQPDGLLIIDQIQRLKLAVQQVKDAGDLTCKAPPLLNTAFHRHYCRLP